MEKIEYYHVIEKSGWDDGVWFSEPDKRQWQDEKTGLPCLMLRGPMVPWLSVALATCVYPRDQLAHLPFFSPFSGPG